MKILSYKCPGCGIKHDIEVDDEAEHGDYDGLCEPCEMEWVNSPEYQRFLEAE